MKRSHIVILFFILLLCIFLFNYTSVISYTKEEKKILVIGSLIGIGEDTINEYKKIEEDDIINTSIKNIGIITGIDLQTKQYAAFGHNIELDNNIINSENSVCYTTQYYEIEKSTKSHIGAIVANQKVENKIGNVIKNTKCGVFGQAENISQYNETNSRELPLGSRYEIKKGEAKLYLDLDGTGIEEYDVIINSIDYFNQTKNIELKVIDKKLIEKTGGVVRGMSGTPIIQNNKIIGAVNCVFAEDSTMAYGIFADKMF